MRLPLFILASLLLAACNTAPPVSPLLRSLIQVNPDGSTSVLPKNNLSPFEHLVLSRIPPAFPNQRVEQLYTLGCDVPDGNGFEGAYAAIFLYPKESNLPAEFQYVEQYQHLPRADRYFHRTLNVEETAHLLAFMQSNPIESLRIPPPPPDPNATQPAEPALVFRFTSANLKGAETINLNDPTADTHPAIELVHLFAHLRDDGAYPQLACVYKRPIPANAAILFADPQRRVLDFRQTDNLVQALIYPPLDYSFVSFDNSSTPVEHWYQHADGQWIPCDPPADPPATDPATDTVPASQPTTVPAPATAADPASQPAATAPASDSQPATTTAQPAEESPFSNPGILPAQETWSAEPLDGFTNLWHYIPTDAMNGLWLGVVVPGLVFEDAHISIDKTRNLIYFINDGQLFSLPIPPAVLIRK